MGGFIHKLLVDENTIRTAPNGFSLSEDGKAVSKYWFCKSRLNPPVNHLLGYALQSRCRTILFE